MSWKGRRKQRQDGRALGFAEYGDPSGRPFFFFQGTPSSRLLHPDEEITSLLGVRLVVIDRPGFGLSGFQPGRTLLDWPDDVAAVADKLGLGSFGVVGISGGGPYALACACRLPHRLTGVALVSSMCPTDDPELRRVLPPVRRVGASIARRAPWLLAPLIWLLQNPQRNPERFFERYTAHNPRADQLLLQQPEFRAMLQASYAEATRSGIRGFAWEVRIVSRSWGFRLEDIPIRIRLWHGEEDTSTPPSMAKSMEQRIPDCRATYLPGEGHFLLFTHWEEILADLIS